MSDSKLKLAEIAARIDAHLKRFEADPKINEPNAFGREPYYRAGSWASGRFVCVKYIAYQGTSHLSRSEALAYLAWLDAGNVGAHYKALRAAAQCAEEMKCR